MMDLNLGFDGLVIVAFGRGRGPSSRIARV
jgi:hypothetical protein